MKPIFACPHKDRIVSFLAGALTASIVISIIALSLSGDEEQTPPTQREQAIARPAETHPADALLAQAVQAPLLEVVVVRGGITTAVLNGYRTSDHRFVLHGRCAIVGTQERENGQVVDPMKLAFFNHGRLIALDGRPGRHLRVQSPNMARAMADYFASRTNVENVTFTSHLLRNPPEPSKSGVAKLTNF